MRRVDPARLVVFDESGARRAMGRKCRDSSAGRFRYRGLATRYRLDTVLMKTLPRETAGEASVISPSEFLPSTLNSGPA